MVTVQKKSTSSPQFSSAILMGLLLLVTGCNSGEAIQNVLSPDPQLSKSQDTTTDNPLLPSSETDNPSLTTTEETPETSNNPEESALISDLPPDFPPEIPIYPEAILETIELQDVETGTSIWRSQNEVEFIVSYYQEQFNQDTWEILQPFSSEPERESNTIIAHKNNLKVKVAILEQPQNEEFPTEIAIAYEPFDDSLSEELSPTTTETTTTPAIVKTGFSDLNETPELLQEAVTEVAALDILNPHSEAEDKKKFAPNEPITRREYARWLVTANNKYYGQSPGKKIRVASHSSQLAFKDITTNDPDFDIIQGLAEAGLIPSVLTGESEVLFRPDAPLTREDLLTWKVPLDIRKALPKASIENINESWGFQDTASISITGLRALFADFQNGDQSNVRRIFGYTTLFQPKKPVTRAEAAASLWYFGFQGDGITAKEALKVTE